MSDRCWRALDVLLAIEFVLLGVLAVLVVALVIELIA